MGYAVDGYSLVSYSECSRGLCTLSLTALHGATQPRAGGIKPICHLWVKVISKLPTRHFWCRFCCFSQEPKSPALQAGQAAALTSLLTSTWMPVGPCRYTRWMCCGEMLYRLAIFSISSKAVSSSRKRAWYTGREIGPSIEQAPPF